MDAETNGNTVSQVDDDGMPNRTDILTLSPAPKTTLTSYMQAVKSYLGGRMHITCGIVQYSKLARITVGYTITTSTSLVAIKKVRCFHRHGHQAYCKLSNNPFMAALGVLQIFLFQIPNFHELTWLSTIACITSFGYALIGNGLSLDVLLQGN
ncbi:hypothetical protein QN277_017496 [Acacia crassicarpa]|uniref:Amino acid transporter transmembrane domain-containing protein n=1 Tax=Acacia crassicarpa TaxID=499986 RepID=A0AAE1JNQ7_9FABA|nr:hypothetical protein QN277_017496 [Acacia crassicarpa]